MQCALFEVDTLGPAAVSLEKVLMECALPYFYLALISSFLYYLKRWCIRSRMVAASPAAEEGLSRFISQPPCRLYELPR